MKKMLLLLNIVLFFLGTTSFAQNDIPKGFEKGSITLADGNKMDGFVKDQIRKSANIQFILTSNGKKQLLDGNNLNAVEINGVKFICLNGDFYKVLSNNEPILVQKSSDVTGKSSYNGVETVISKGNDGKIDDQFQYISTTNELKPVTAKKN